MSSERNDANGSGHQSNTGGTVTLPLEEVLRLTTLQDDDSEIFGETQIEPQRRYSRNSRASNSKSPRTHRRKGRGDDFERENPRRTKSGSSNSSRGSRNLKKAVKNERKSVDKVVAAAIRKYEEYDKSPTSSLRKTRTTPGRTKSGGSISEKKKKAYATTSEARDYKKKGRKKNTSNENSTEQQQQQQGQAQAQDPPQETRARLPLESESRDSSTHSGSAHIDAAGAIAVYPSDSNRPTTRLDRSEAPHRISVAGNFLTSSEFNQIRDPTDEDEVPVLPPESQIIDAVVTYRNPRQERTTVSDMDTLTTAPTVATSVVRDSESGTVTARAVSSENYYQEVRRQLQKEAVAAVAVVALQEDESIHNNKKKSKSINDIEMQNINDHNANKGKGKKFWTYCAIATLVILVVSIGGGIAVAMVRRRKRSNNNNQNQNNDDSLDCDQDMACRMDTMMTTDAGQYWRGRLLQMLPHSTLVNILEDSSFMSPQYQALDFVTSNAEMLFGFSLDVLMDMDKIGEFNELSRLTTLFALVTMYHSMNGPEWYAQTNWLRPEVDLCEWFGVECFGESIQKVADAVRGNGADAIAAPPLGDTDDIVDLDTTLREKPFELDDRDGYFTDQLKFHSLSLMANNLGGNIPEEISLLSNIYGQINLSRNNIEGSIPTDMAKLSKLQAIRLNSNDLSSTIPTGIARFNLLRIFDISHNPRITGDISSFEAGWRNIELIKIENTDLTGTIPVEFCDSLDNRVNFQPRYVPEFMFFADCGEPNPQVDCPCCTDCCSNGNGGVKCSPNV